MVNLKSDYLMTTICFTLLAHFNKDNNNKIIIASRDDDDGVWYDYLQRQNVQLREMMCEMSEEI